MIKNEFFCIFVLGLYLISAPVLFKKPTPSQINLIENAKNNFLLVTLYLCCLVGPLNKVMK